MTIAVSSEGIQHKVVNGLAMVQVTHHGRAAGVTDSWHPLQVDAENNLLFDCALFESLETSPEGNIDAERLAIAFALARVNVHVANHLQVDHVGRIPYLLVVGFKGPTLCSEPSAKLLPIVLEDAFKLGFSRDQKQVERYLKLIEQRIVALPYKQWFTLIDTPQLNARIRLQRAGHILGSAYVEVDLHYPETGEKKRIVFSGDLGAPHAPILPAPKAPYKADILVIESTYGDRLHEDRRSRRARLEKVLEHALRNQGTVLIPAFSIGRTEELLYELEDIIHRRALKESAKGQSSASKTGHQQSCNARLDKSTHHSRLPAGQPFYSGVLRARSLLGYRGEGAFSQRP